MASSIGKVDFLPLERYNLSSLLDSQLFHHHKNIGVLLFSFSKFIITKNTFKIQKLRMMIYRDSLMNSTQVTNNISMLS